MMLTKLISAVDGETSAFFKIFGMGSLKVDGNASAYFF